MSGYDRRRSPDIARPVLILAAAVLVWQLAGAVNALLDRQALTVLAEAQGRAGQEADRIRRQIDDLLSGTTDLARNGNASAKTVIESLARQGVTYNNDAPRPAAKTP